MSPLKAQVVLGDPKFKLRKKDVEIELLKREHRKLPLMVWWYGEVKGNPGTDRVPKVKVYFRQLTKDNQPGMSEEIEVPLTLLGQLRIGSVWQYGRLIADRVFGEQQLVPVDFTSDKWRLVSADVRLAGADALLRLKASEYALPMDSRKSWLLEFEMPSGGFLYVPCLGFFSRCYGRSKEVNRVLAVYPFEEAKRRLFVPAGQPTEPGRWVIRLKKHSYNADAVFLAHVAHDTVAQRAAQWIYSQLEVEGTTGTEANTKPHFVAVKSMPWFEGQATLVVDGVSINDGKDFLALQILGCSDPAGPEIERERENAGSLGEAAGTPGDVPEQGEKTVYITAKRYPDVAVVTDQETPDAGASRVRLPDPHFLIPGEQRVVHGIPNTGRSGEVKRRKGSDPADKLSTGEPEGKGKEAGHGSFIASEVLESNGVIIDVWTALKVLKPLLGGTDLNTVTFDDQHQLQFHDDLQRMTLLPNSTVEDAEAAPVEPSSWDYLVLSKAKTPDNARGLLVARLTLGSKALYVVEVQRRQRKVKLDAPKPGAEPERRFKDEAGKGFMFVTEARLKPDEEGQLDVARWLSRMRAEIRLREGAMEPVSTACIVFGYLDSSSFIHNRTRYEVSHYAAALVNTMIKVHFLNESVKSIALAP